VVQTLRNDKSARGVVAGNTLRASAGELAPRSGWDEPRGDGHLVQFYESDDFLLDTLSDFLAAGLEEGDSCLVVAKSERREGLDARLRARGHDPEAERQRGRLVTLDAAETLSGFMVGDAPEPSRFQEAVGGLIERVSAGGRRVRVFGEMVALLWADGRCDAALSLEALWNGLQKSRPFTLFCAYPMSCFGGDPQAGPLAHVCAEHSRVIPAESYTAHAGADERLLAIVELQRKAALLEAEVAERQRLLVRERAARTEAEEANRLKDEFLATVSHELRTPLTAIIGWSHMLRHAGLEEATVRRGLETIERNAKAQAQLVEDILDVSRIITGKLRLNIAPVDLASVVGAAIDSVQLAAESKGIRLEVTLDATARQVSGDAGRLQQVVWNLLSNAIKFTNAGGGVGVRLRRAGADAELSVSDDGCGISPDFLPFIFDRFRQADGTSTRLHGGLGLGLAIARNLAELHGGTITAASPGPGLGTTFTVKLPLAAAA
jgi:signal transduction histidine kinase